MMGIQEILNFIQIDDLTASGGQPSEIQFRDAQTAGYGVVINLAPDGLETSLPNEEALLKSINIEYHHIPVDWKNPSLDDLDKFIAVMENSSGRKLIHCQANFRVTAFYSLYAMDKLGWSAQQAQTLMDRVWTTRPGFEMDNAWKKFIDEASYRISQSK
jgi:protein tyrosine phosphatase (PTP) superfamily phosphohydrolase (DUF442 family)